MIDFWKRVKKNLDPEKNQNWLCNEIAVSSGTMSSWITHDRLPKADLAVRIAKALGVSVEYLVTGDDEDFGQNQETVSQAIRQHAIYRTPRNQEIPLNPEDDVLMLPVLVVSSYNISSLKAVEVRGDSMTGVRMFDGDIVVFAAGYISSEGIYVLSVNGDVLVKRVEFDSFDKTIKVSSENPRYPDIKTVSIDDENVEIKGKVVAWFHCHPY